MDAIDAIIFKILPLYGQKNIDDGFTDVLFRKNVVGLFYGAAVRFSGFILSGSQFLIRCYGGCGVSMRFNLVLATYSIRYD